MAVPPIIPPNHNRRTLVLCFDGTGDQFDDDNSNIVQFLSMLRKDSKANQLVYYQTGIGTYQGGSHGSATWLGRKLGKILDSALALYLDDHVKDGYQFLMQNYDVGDAICLFGFSRGAYTARALAGMLHKVGLLPRDNQQQVPFAWKMYKRTDDLGWEQSTAFKKAFSIDVDIQFLGVFDTVSSVGLIGKTLPFTTSNYAVRYFRHAVALDERRAKFKANLWNRPTPAEEKLGVLPPPSSSNSPETPNAVGDQPWDRQRRIEKQRYMDKEKAFSSSRLNTPTDILEVWFSGCHCDVGGGSVPNSTRNSLARIPLRWMIRQCFLTNTGIMFDVDGLAAIGLNPAHLYPEVLPASQIMNETFNFLKSQPPMVVHGQEVSDAHTLVGGPSQSSTLDNGGASPVAESSYRPKIQLLPVDVSPSSTPPPSSLSVASRSEAEENVNDARSPIYDQLTKKWIWWILELMPLPHRYQRGDKTWVRYISVNFAQPRFIPKQSKGYFVHNSVKLRMQATGYIPRAQFKEPPTWVD